MGIDLTKMLDGLSSSDIDSLLVTMDELDKMEKLSSVDKYSPLPTQDAFHRDPHAVRIFSGGNQVGKSTCGCKEAQWHIFGTHPYRKVKVPSVGRIITSQGFNTGLDQVILPKLDQFIPKEHIRNVKKNQYGVPIRFDYYNGSVVHLMSTEQKFKVFEGATVDWAWIDEPPDEPIYKANLRAIMRNGGSIWLTMTPVIEDANSMWLYNTLYEPWDQGDDSLVRSVMFFFASLEENLEENGGVISRKDFEMFKAGLNPDEIEARVYGRFMIKGGRIFSEYRDNIHLIDNFDWPKEWPVIRAIDPHPAKDDSVLWVGIMPGNFYCAIDELSNNKDVATWSQLILEREGERGYNIIDSVIDTSINVEDKEQRMSRKRMLEQCGIRSRFPTKKNMVEPGIMYMKTLMKPSFNEFFNKEMPKLTIMRRCPKTADNFRRYRRNENGMVIKKNDDWIDPFRYAISTQADFSKRFDVIRNVADNITTYGQGASDKVFSLFR